MTNDQVLGMFATARQLIAESPLQALAADGSIECSGAVLRRPADGDEVDDDVTWILEYTGTTIGGPNDGATMKGEVEIRKDVGYHEIVKAFEAAAPELAEAMEPIPSWADNLELASRALSRRLHEVTADKSHVRTYLYNYGDHLERMDAALAAVPQSVSSESTSGEDLGDDKEGA